MGRVPLLADEYVTVFESPDPEVIYAGSPGITCLASGRLVATLGLRGPGLTQIPGNVGRRRGIGRDSFWQGRVYTSDDRGSSWVLRTTFPFLHARPFVAGNSLYVLGHCGDLMVIRSDDQGETWSEPARLSEGQQWHQAPCNVHYANGKVYLVMELNTDPRLTDWPVSVLAPVVMSGRLTDDLGQSGSWTFSNAVSFRDLVPRPVGIGVPFFRPGATVSGNCKDRRSMAPIGWLETNLVQFVDPDHIWYDPSGRSLYLWMRAHTGWTNLAAIARMVEDEAGRMTVSLAEAPSGEKVVYVPCPGGHMKFHIIYDQRTQLYWLLSSLSTDSMTRPERLPPTRYNLPNNERHRLALYFSRNCVDWQIAGLVCMGRSCLESRHYASMAIDGEDLQVLSRSGDSRAKSAHDGNLITLHTVKDFRTLVY